MSEHPTDTQPPAELAPARTLLGSPFFRAAMTVAVVATIGMVAVLAASPGADVALLQVVGCVAGLAALGSVIAYAVRDGRHGAPR